MADNIVTYKPLTKIYLAIVLGTLLFLVLGYYIGSLYLPLTSWDWIPLLAFFVGLPVLVTGLGFYIGWYGKKSAIEYTDPTWTVEPVQMSIDDAKALVKDNNRKNWKLVSNSSYWTFFIPIALLIFMAGLPVYTYFETSILTGFEQWIFSLAFALSYAVSSIGALLASSNSATEDFDILLVREAIALAKAQEKVPGLAHVRVVFDKGVIGEFEMYESPRVVARISGIERDAYIESWAEDLNAVTRVLCRLHEAGDIPQTVWWWMSRDRNFRKFVGTDEQGYYVRLPVPRGDLGVKDITAVFENAVAIIILEWLKTRGENEALSGILKELNAVPPEG